MTLGDLANVIKHAEVVLDLLEGSNTVDTLARLRALCDGKDSVGKLHKLVLALDGLRLNLRPVRLAAVTVGE
jgi:hypothetical protein